MGEYLFLGAMGGVIFLFVGFWGFCFGVGEFCLEPFFEVGEVVIDGVEGVCGYGWLGFLGFVYEVGEVLEGVVLFLLG